MLESYESKELKIAEYKGLGEKVAVDGIEDEFYWFVDQARISLEEIGFQVVVERFSDFSFGILAKKPTQGTTNP